MIRKYFFLAIISVINFSEYILGNSDYIICGSYANSFIPGQIFVYDSTSCKQINSFYTITQGSNSHIAYFNNNNTWQICYSTAYSIVICNTDGSNSKTFSVDYMNKNWEPNCLALIKFIDQKWKILIGYTNGKIALWDIDSTQLSVVFDDTNLNSGPYGIMAFTLFHDNNTTYVAAASSNGTVCIYDLITGKVNHIFYNPNADEKGILNSFTSVAVFQDEAGFSIVAGGDRGYICCWNINSEELVYNINIYNDQMKRSIIQGLMLLKDANGKILLAPYSYYINSIQLFDAQTGSLITALQSNIETIADMRPYRINDSTKIVVGFGDIKGSVQLWDVESQTLEKEFSVTTEHILYPPIQNICLYTSEESVNCALANGWALSHNTYLGNLTTVKLKNQLIEPCIEINSFMTSVASNDEASQRKDLFALSHDCIHGSHIPIFNLSNLQCITCNIN